MLLERSDGGLGRCAATQRNCGGRLQRNCRRRRMRQPADGKLSIVAAMATATAHQIRRRFWGRQPLCGTGVTSLIELIRMPSAASARTDDSRPGPGPLIRTSRFLMPCSCAARPATSAATWAANGVDLREPLNPWPPEDAQASDPPWRSVMVMMVLRNAVRNVLADLLAHAACGGIRWCFCHVVSRSGAFVEAYFLSAAAPLRGPLRVRALVRVRWPRIGKPRRWRRPR